MPERCILRIIAAQSTFEANLLGDEEKPEPITNSCPVENCELRGRTGAQDGIVIGVGSCLLHKELFKSAASEPPKDEPKKPEITA